MALVACGLSDGCGAALGDMLARNGALLELRLAQNRFAVDAARALASGLTGASSDDFAALDAAAQACARAAIGTLADARATLAASDDSTPPAGESGAAHRREQQQEQAQALLSPRSMVKTALGSRVKLANEHGPASPPPTPPPTTPSPASTPLINALKATSAGWKSVWNKSPASSSASAVDTATSSLAALNNSGVRLSPYRCASSASSSSASASSAHSSVRAQC